LGAIPHFVDSEERTLGLDPKKLLSYLQEIGTIRGGECFNRFTGHRIKAVVPMHTFGHPVDLDPLVELCKNFHLVLVEDAAESLGSYYKGKHTGNLGKVSILSFNGNKTITTGGGGAILTNNKELGKFAKHLTTTAKIPHRWEYQHDNIGFNFRLPNINAAIGCAQMEQLDNFINKKRALAERYQDAFKNFDGIKVFKEASFAQSNYWLNVLLFNEIYADQREDLLELTNNNNIMTRPSWTPIHKLTMYKDCPRMDLSVAESLEKRIVNIPSSVIL
jgi:perosamine synthetase